MPNQFTEIPYPIELILRDNCSALTPQQLEPRQKLVLRRPKEPAQAEIICTVIDTGPYLQTLMLDTQPPRIVHVSITGLQEYCRRTDLLVNRALYENLALAQSVADAAMQRFLRPTTK